MLFTLADVAAAMDAELVGNGALRITGAAEPQAAGPEDLALATNPKYAEAIPAGQARAAMLWTGADWQALGVEGAILPKRPRYALSGLTAALDPGPEVAPGIHETAVVDPSAEIAEDVAIGPLVVIGARVRIGPRARIAPHVSIAEDTVIGPDALLHAGVRIGARVTIGARFIAQSGVIIGGDGFSFVTPEQSVVEEIRRTVGDRGTTAGQSWTRIHSLGGVTIGDDVEIGSGTCVDRGTIRDTTIGRGTKIDNLVQVAHNVEIGEDCLFCAHVGFGGSARVGDRVVFAGKVGVNDNISVGDDVVAGGAAKIFTRVPAGRILLGDPAVKMETQLGINKAVRRLPRLAAQVAELQKAVSKLQGKD